MTMNLIRKIVQFFGRGKQPGDDHPTARPTVDQSVPPDAPDRGVDIYESIMGAEVQPVAGEDMDRTVQRILSAVQDSEEDGEERQRREQIIGVCREILAEKDRGRKIEKAKELISLGSGVTAIALYVIHLKQAVRSSQT